MKKICTYLAVFTALWLFAAGCILRQEHLAARMIRLHIVANSDSSADQAEKLRVRDALLPEIDALTADCTSRAEAAEVLASNAARLGAAAAELTGERVTVRLAPEWYGTRRYDSFSLPAGRYLSLQIGIGSAAGHNWWCVAFPSVCTAATAEEFETVAVSGGFGGSDLRMMAAEEPDVEVRYFVLELVERIHALLRGAR